MALRLMGKKRGMTQLFDAEGNVIVCTVIQAEPNVVTQVKTKQSDGYDAVQLGFDKLNVADQRTAEKRLGKPRIGCFNKIGEEPRRHLAESRIENPAEFAVGQKIGVEFFEEIAFVDAMAISKGKGYQGVMKLHNHAGGPAAHGSGFHRHKGATGQRSTPGRCFPGGKRASQMGLDRITVQSLAVVKVDLERNLILVKGAVPGANGGLVYLSPAVKKKTKIAKK